MGKLEETTELDNDTKALKEVKTDKELAKRTKEPFIGTWLDAPKFIRDNEYIRGGYRVNFNTVKKILRSLFMIHNESMNIWSHLVGVVMFMIFVGYIAIYLTPKISFTNFNQQLQNKVNFSYLNSQFF
jgi:adiponectin receptor